MPYLRRRCVLAENVLHQIHRRRYFCCYFPQYPRRRVFWWKNLYVKYNASLYKWRDFRHGVIVSSANSKHNCGIGGNLIQSHNKMVQNAISPPPINTPAMLFYLLGTLKFQLYSILIIVNSLIFTCACLFKAFFFSLFKNTLFNLLLCE